jgi:hypothetical protein
MAVVQRGDGFMLVKERGQGKIEYHIAKLFLVWCGVLERTRCRAGCVAQRGQHFSRLDAIGRLPPRWQLPNAIFSIAIVQPATGLQGSGSTPVGVGVLCVARSFL